MNYFALLQFNCAYFRELPASVSICERACLDRRRLEEAYLKYCVLQMYQRYTDYFAEWTVASSILQTLEEITPTFYMAFSAYYACKNFYLNSYMQHGNNHVQGVYFYLATHISLTAHLCSYPGCNKVLVLDGNMKNRRNVCAAKEAGLIEYPNLSGAIKTGCQSSPLQTSKYCFHHAPRVSTQLDLCDPDQLENVSSLQPNHTNQEGVVSYIVQKKITRSSIYYQVCMLSNILM